MFKNEELLHTSGPDGLADLHRRSSRWRQMSLYEWVTDSFRNESLPFVVVLDFFFPFDVAKIEKATGNIASKM